MQELIKCFPLGAPIVGETAQKDFIQLFGEILRLLNIHTSFDEFEGNEILSPRQNQDYRSVYLDLWNEFKTVAAGDKESINDDVVFEIELIKQVEINVDYFLMLVQKYREERGDGDDKEMRAEITRAIDSSPSLRNKKDLIEDFVDSISTEENLDNEWQRYVEERKEAELNTIIEDENLRVEETRAFVDSAFRDGAIQETGTAVTKILPPVSRFSADRGHAVKKQRVLQKLGVFFERFRELVSKVED